jgi:diguanylate cyclase (GGDEF)-like protein/hemerythrin-like metal-binding protein
MVDVFASPPFSKTWLADDDARAFFAEFPLALAVAGDRPEGPVFNQRFDALLGAGALAAGPLRDLLQKPEQAWTTLQLTTKTGGTLEVRAQTQRLAFGLLLLVEEVQVPSGELASLRARIADLELLSATDPLTHAWNRAHLDRTVETELSRSVRFRQPLSLVLVDVDHFKQINDGHGHQAGDAVLVELVAVMRQCIRSADVLFRWGGEEFVVLAPSTGHRSAVVLAEKLRAAVERHDFPVVGRVTVSAGVAEHLGTENAADWFQRLDSCLYQAKRDGRNRVSCDSRGSSDGWQRASSSNSALRLQWSEAYDSGEAPVDLQHRELFDLANDLIDAAAVKPRSPVATKEAFTRLAAHIQDHFRDEEALLARIGYPKLEAHSRAHSRILTKALELELAAEAGEVQFGEVVDFLANEVVSRHLFAADRDFFPLLGAPRAG